MIKKKSFALEAVSARSYNTDLRPGQRNGRSDLGHDGLGTRRALLAMMAAKLPLLSQPTSASDLGLGYACSTKTTPLHKGPKLPASREDHGAPTTMLLGQCRIGNAS